MKIEVKINFICDLSISHIQINNNTEKNGQGIQ